MPTISAVPQSEKSLQASILKHCRSIPDMLIFKVPAGPFSQAGIADLIGCYQGRFLAIEVKVLGNTPTPRQKLFLGQASASGAVAFVARSVQDVRDKFHEEFGLPIF